MLNRIIEKLNGHGSEAESLEAALLQLGRDRETAQRELTELQVRRHQALLDDAADTVLDKLERDILRKETRLEKFHLAEPGVRERLEAAQKEARKRRWHALYDAYRTAAREFLTSARAATAAHSALVEANAAARREGFEAEASATMPATPNLNGHAVLAPDLLDNFELAVAPPVAPKRKATAPKSQKSEHLTWEPKGDTFAKLPREMTTLQHAISSVWPAPGSLGFMTAHRSADDDGPLAPGEARVLALTSGWHPRDNAPQCHAGQKIRMTAEAAQAAANRGQVEILEQYTLPPAGASSAEQPGGTQE